MPRRGRKRFRVPESFRVRASEQVRPDPATIPLDYQKAKAIYDWLLWEDGVETKLVPPPEAGAAWTVEFDDLLQPGAKVKLRTLGDAKPYFAALSLGQRRHWPPGHRLPAPEFGAEAMDQVRDVLERVTPVVGQEARK